MAVFSCIFAGQFYDDLCDYYQDDPAALKAALTSLADGADTGDPHGKFLMICLQYDGIYRDLPDPIWWLSGSPAFAERFADGFLAHFTNAADVGGVYNGQWIQAITRWTTKVYGKPVIPSLPKTGY